MGAENILYGPEPWIPIADGTAGKQLYDSLLRHQHLPEALVDAHTHEVLSYKTLLEKSCRLAQSLYRYGGFSGNMVLSICSENSLQYYYPVLAALYLGIPVAPLNPEYVEDELRRPINIAKPKIIFCSKYSLDKILSLKSKCPFIQNVIVLDSQQNIKDAQSLDQFIIAHSDRDFNAKQFKPLNFDRTNRVALVMGSSGTTGLPKGVMMSHQNLVVRFAQTKDPIYSCLITPGITVLSVVPLFHAFGMNSTLGFLITGLRTVLMKKFDGELFLKTIQDYKVKCVYVVPAIMVFLAKSPLVDKYDLSSLEDMGSSAAPLSKETSDEAMKRLVNVHEIRQGYGLTEATLALTFMPKGNSKEGSVGKLMPYVTAKVVDSDSGRILGPGQPGEFHFKGPQVMLGYLGDEGATKNTIDRNGWLHTGDYGYYDKDGFFYILDRLKELIKYKGYQVPPAELEGILIQNPRIKDVGVIGIPDEVAGELPVAFVVKQPGVNITEQEIIDYVAGKVSNPKRLRGGIKFVEEIPRNPSGKILRRILRELVQKKKSKL